MCPRRNEPRPIARGGFFVIVLNGAYFESGGFDGAFHDLQDDGRWRMLKLEQFNYMTELLRPGYLLVAARL